MPRPVEYINGKKTFTVLENNPTILTSLAHTLGLSSRFSFQDIYSLTDPDLLALIPRPVLALVVILPLTPAWKVSREKEDEGREELAGYGGAGEENILWFMQLIGHACGTHALLHTVLNSPASMRIPPNTPLSRLRDASLPLTPRQRAELLYNNKEIEEAHQEAADMGDTVPPSAEEGERLGLHFVGFVVHGGYVWELEGARKGPINRGSISPNEDILSPRGLELGLGRFIEMEKESARAKGDPEGGDVRFSCVALVDDRSVEG